MSRFDRIVLTTTDMAAITSILAQSWRRVCDLLATARQVKSSYCCDTADYKAPVHKYWEEILNDYLIPGKIDPIELFVTHRIGIHDVAKCYPKFDKHEDGLVKVFVETKFSDAPATGAPKKTSM